MLKYIGIVRENKDGKGIIEIYKEYIQGLYKLEEFSHIIVISWLNKVSEEQRNTLIVRPRGLLKYGFRLEDLPEVGVFCTDSPHRPNPIAISIVKLIKRQENLLHVEDLDLFEETPILDIKAFTPARCPDDVKVPKWVEEFEKKLEEIKRKKTTF
ncbi:tRNA (N6-threonylcarbamoyladenosine(37)-N6)-methyltransferase TrmO [Sulfurisphaera ohwakuensis]|uniref:tRNA (N6-threonylcarbamoyladenosine(37)-N6)-methyltransferase TrmO n=1 Tax=Sulfurisphaera ohwakuensis TaxID=69656 RepID=A0A650CLL3_SULOH|nr:tRNA (N6-threonylcarbamoyladenosine(37)-N6)-methyltransferase TrmO [Sulfurisphaera ohwakuensis]MBB5253659.1 tRNA-Thr(GGU) m(6)t(6)A37 methyltransferase TsaA [Sulfurisphaera ohwakuensis]QGR18357.1 tRNA (N6-threonylcarbamoyladenosine(37)-N6)-methyltransferase TrmO [Sulfurisphaera ohwakuensis]